MTYWLLSTYLLVKTCSIEHSFLTAKCLSVVMQHINVPNHFMIACYIKVN